MNNTGGVAEKNIILCAIYTLAIVVCNIVLCVIVLITGGSSSWANIQGNGVL